MNNLKVVGEPKKLAGSAMAIDKGHEDELKAINQALADLKADGTYTKLYQNGSASIRQRKNCNRICPFFTDSICSAGMLKKIE